MFENFLTQLIATQMICDTKISQCTVYAWRISSAGWLHYSCRE